MDIYKLSELLQRQYKEENVPKDHTGAIAFVTGDSNIDLYLHHLEKKYGIKLNIVNYYGNNTIKEYEVVDQQKFMMFILRWS